MIEKPFSFHNPNSSESQKILKARAFDTVAVGDELEPKVYSVTRGDLVNYAGVVGDTNPIHFSDVIARSMGLDDVCVHGMFSMGVGSSYITRWLGDPRAVKEYTVRFVSPWYVPATVPGIAEFTGKIKSLDSETRTGVIVINARQDNRRIFGKAAAVVQFS